MTKRDEEFQEIGHCGGQYTVEVKTSEDGRRSIQLGMRHSRPVPASFTAIYSLPQGIPVGTIQLGGVGQPWNPPPTPDCRTIFIASDSRGMFGHQCPMCKGYWRSKSSPSRWLVTCPYCGLREAMHNFITDGQLRYIRACCDLIERAVASEKDGEHIIDMDQVADAVGKGTEKPKFYYSEQSQQNNYKCKACGDTNDILGRYGYCSCCGTFNAILELESDIQRIQQKASTSEEYEACTKDAIGAFDSYARQFAKQLVTRVPMSPNRQKQWRRKLFHNLRASAIDLSNAFDIDLFKDINKGDIEFTVLMFHRRHIYEHNGGEVDEKYIRDSGDTTVKPKQVIRETKESVLRIAELVLRLAKNLHDGFHLIFPPEEIPIKSFSR